MSLSDVMNVRTFPVISSASSEIIDSMMSSTAPRPMNGRFVKRVIPATASAVSSGQPLTFNLQGGMGAGVIRSGSVYVKASIACTFPAQGAATTSTLSFAGRSGSASAVILRSTIYANGTLIEQINHYNKLRELLLCHSSSQGYAGQNSAVLEGAYQTYTSVANTAQTMTVPACIPLLSGIFSAQQDYPLYLFGNSQVILDLDTIANAYYATTTGANPTTNPTDFSVNNAYLCYDVFQPDSAFESDMKAVLASGKLFQIVAKQWYNLLVPNASGASVPIGLNSSSVLAVLQTTTTQGLTNQKLLSGDTPTNFQAFFDGELKTPYPYDSASFQYLNLLQALGVNSDVERSSIVSPSVPLTQALFQSSVYGTGVGTMKAQSSGFSMAGTPASQVVVNVANAGSANTSLYVFCALETIITVDAMGTCQIIR